MDTSINLSHRETKLVIDEVRNLLVTSRLQRVFESSPRCLVFQFRAPGTTYHLLMSTEPDDTRLHLVASKPDQPDHPSPFTMRMRKFLHGAWLQDIEISEQDRIVYLRLDAIEPDWEPQREDERAPRRRLTFVAELLGRHPNFIVFDEDRRVVEIGPGPTLGDRFGDDPASYEEPPPPPEWADTDQVRPVLRDQPPDGSRSRALSRHFQQSIEERRRKALKQELQSELKDQFERLDRRVGHIEDDLQRIDDADEYRRRGELLQSAYGDVEAGSSSVTVPDFYRDGMPSIEISLDPSKSLQENIDHYFHEYRRLTEARDKVEQRLLDSMETRDEIQEARRTLEGLELVDELQEFRDELRDRRILKTPAQKSHSGPRQQQALPPYREFRATSSSPILVGRNAEANDELTTTVARGRDLWLHTRNFPGSHVILRMRKDEELKSEDLVDAATLAAHFSDGRRNTVVEVTYTHKKYIRKPGGAPPGTVTVGGGGSTIAVRIEDERLQRILDTEISHR